MTDFVISSGVTTGYTVVSGDTLTVDAGGTSSASVISSGGSASVFGSSFGDTINKLGIESIESGASATSVTVAPGGALRVLKGAVAAAVSEAPDGLVKTNVWDKGVISDSVLAGTVNILNGGVLISSTLEGEVTVQAGGSASFNTVRALPLNVQSGAHVAHDTVTGKELISAGGKAYYEQLTRGTQDVAGTAYFTTATAAALIVEAGGLMSGAVIGHSGATDSTETVKSGGTTSLTTIEGGILSAHAGSTVAGWLNISGGGKAILDGTVAEGAKVNIKAGTAELGDLADFHGVIYNMKTSGQKLDLDGFAFSGGRTASWTQNGASGTLTVHDGAKTASLTLVGTYASNSFHLADDGHGGTIVTDPRPASLVQAIAVHGGGSAVPLGHVSGRDAASAPLIAVGSG